MGLRLIRVGEGSVIPLSVVGIDQVGTVGLRLHCGVAQEGDYIDVGIDQGRTVGLRPDFGHVVRGLRPLRWN